MPPKFKFVEGERVLCFHGPLLYEAKCIKSEQKEKTIRYFVHYQGWNKSWDEWVPEDRVLKFNDTNTKRQRELENAQKAAKGRARKNEKTKGRGEKDRDVPSPAPSESSQKGTKTKSEGGKESKEAPAKKKPKLEPFVETEEEYTTKIEVQIKLPDEIKTWLVDDWDFITRQKKLLDLPAKVTVDKVLNDFLEYKEKKQEKTEPLSEIFSGVKEYFNIMIGTQLLYKFERPQYQKIFKEVKEGHFSSYYGLIHFCRLFVKLGQMLAFTTLDEKEIETIKMHIGDLLNFIVKQNYFSPSDYINTTPDYQRKVLLG
ncbi:Mortality factor 4-like protein 1 [Halotydeus destructor]|nr:Mortality factor 4-like protein 1 [Halotydeus destructor]